MERPTTADGLKNWVYNEMELLDNRARNVVRYHSFPFPPPLQWLSDYLPRLNQSVLLASALPPVVIDMSTKSATSFRYPPTWSSFVQYRVNLSVIMNPLPISHPSLPSRQREEYWNMKKNSLFANTKWRNRQFFPCYLNLALQIKDNRQVQIWNYWGWYTENGITNKIPT